MDTMNENQSVWLTVSKGTIQVGNNFVNAVIGEIQSHGNIELRRGGPRGEPMIYVWTSTLPINESEKILRQCATKENLHVQSFKSQAL